MSIETEKKYRIAAADRERIVQALEGADAKFVRRDHEKNIIFSGGALAERSAIIRLRKTEHSTVLTFKRRIENEGDVKRQIEHETEVSDPDAATAIIAELGLTPVLVYEKYRDTWEFGSVEVVIDELPFGHFMEIEGSREDIGEAETALGFKGFVVENETYPQLTAKLGTNNNGVIESRFETNGEI